MPKKLLALAICLLATAILMSGCGKKSDEQLAADNQSQEQNQGQADNQANEPVNPSGSYSINELLTMNRPMKCSWSESATAGSEVTNIIYINGKKFYQDVTMGDIGHAYTISDGEYFYLWNDFTDTASKMKYSEIKTSSEPGQAPAQGSAGRAEKRDFVCENWSVDNAIFNPPADKNFKDVSAEMQQVTEDLTENSDKYKQQACDSCQKAPSQELRDTCLKNMQCDL